MSAQAGLFRKYALDTSFIVDLWTREGSHPRDRYAGLWDHFEKQVDTGEVIAPHEVREELANSYGPSLDKWLTRHRQMFIEISRPQLEVLQEIVRKYPDFARSQRNMADPAVVALAAAEGLIVLTSEHHKQNPSPTEPKIPNVCQEHRVSWLGVNDYLRAENVVLR